ncbi:hypothetical protein BCR44DRAFT_403373 [Catenaria anguillulae PL171]|uniref:Uncharacterized protein n=1 Tax=Catenaria anguillulae PL171 TaxID=765915 RepID=A0A1Y2HIV2_9FUNG|nr:hypothetical protein BCR44DRAFT_403373 [Catenaria anguillulae PL171]
MVECLGHALVFSAPLVAARRCREKGDIASVAAVIDCHITNDNRVSLIRLPATLATTVTAVTATGSQSQIPPPTSFRATARSHASLPSRPLYCAPAVQDGSIRNATGQYREGDSQPESRLRLASETAPTSSTQHIQRHPPAATAPMTTTSNSGTTT